MYADLQDTYIFATTGDGTISTLDAADTLVNHGSYGGTWVSFGEDINKELYIADISGGIYRIQGAVLSTSEFNLENSLIINPNPASENIKISTVQNNKLNAITIFDIKGNTIYTEKNISILEKEILVNSFSAGLYIVKVTTQNGNQISKKLIIN